MLDKIPCGHYLSAGFTAIIWAVVVMLVIRLHRHKSGSNNKTNTEHQGKEPEEKVFFAGNMQKVSVF